MKLLPYIGAALDELLFGGLDHARWSRLQSTLKELGEMMEARKIPAESAQGEDFGGLLEITGSAIGQTTSEDKRSLLRDLLLNAVSLPPSDPEWESAKMAAGLLSQIDPPGLAILATLHQLDCRGAVTAELRRSGNSGEIRRTDHPETAVPLHYNWFVLENAYRGVSNNQPRLVILGPHGKDTYELIALTPLGEFLLKWATVPPIADIP